jgi:hypothetical protein
MKDTGVGLGEVGTVPRVPNNDVRLGSAKLCLYFLHFKNLYTKDESINWIAEFGSPK